MLEKVIRFEEICYPLLEEESFEEIVIDKTYFEKSDQQSNSGSDEDSDLEDPPAIEVEFAEDGKESEDDKESVDDSGQILPQHVLEESESIKSSAKKRREDLFL